jgi:hypothetical protein
LVSGFRWISGFTHENGKFATAFQTVARKFDAINLHLIP